MKLSKSFIHSFIHNLSIYSCHQKVPKAFFVTDAMLIPEDIEWLKDCNIEWE